MFGCLVVDTRRRNTSSPSSLWQRPPSSLLPLLLQTDVHTSYLIFAPPPLRYEQGRNYFFDFGSTSFAYEGRKDSLARQLQRFKKYSHVDFDDIFCWEAKINTRPSNYWAEVPPHLIPKMHFYNVPIQSDLDSAMSAVRIIQQVATKRDYVVVKLDIDNNPVETAIMDQVLHSAHLLSLIDELFWEHHVKGSPSQWHHWGDLAHLKGDYANLTSSYKAFLALRQAGIRAHSWV
uniref:Uncharacterized protein n=1 Tax=Eutreptiella gymnastica TaxID=73025 RepID=A0A6U7U943_9EUGL|mmetsp:Transcript_121905/g.211632  ORF Transcript_121905/g.211632 Transcript_121905/m.211632 type:complete len:233 (+) Transcript_121905:426-1124(+)